MICPICNHADRTDIETRLSAGEGHRVLAAMFMVPVNSIARHQKEHSAQVAVQIVTSPSRTLLDLERVELDAWVVVKMAKEGVFDQHGKMIAAPDAKLMLAGLDQVRKTKETQVKLAKELAMFKAGMVPREAFDRLTSLIQVALEPFPEALRAVQEAMAEVEA
ncbi:MAG: hypothetical protein ABSG46_18190 [Candidatus Binataceae bacterium]|jgi:hypothetical protein